MIKFIILLTINNTLGILSHFDKQMLTLIASSIEALPMKMS